MCRHIFTYPYMDFIAFYFIIVWLLSSNVSGQLLRKTQNKKVIGNRVAWCTLFISACGRQR